jgi:hypothetical protein
VLSIFLKQKGPGPKWDLYTNAEARTNDDSVVSRVFDRNCLPLFIYTNDQLDYLLTDHQGLSANGVRFPKGLINDILKFAGLNMYACAASRAFAMRGINTSLSVRKSSMFFSLKRSLDVLFYSAVALAQLSYFPVEELAPRVDAFKLTMQVPTLLES